MKAMTILPDISNAVLSTFLGTFLFYCNVAQAETISPKLQAKVDQCKKQLVEWATTPLIITEVKKSNKKVGISGMSNFKWDELSDTNPAVTRLSQNAAGKQLAVWAERKLLEKLILRDEKGTIVAFSYQNGKPLIYNIGNRKTFLSGMKRTWDEGIVKPDPTTQSNSVQISTPVMDNGKAIGVIHAAVLAE
jgi:hypothetical protein